MIYESCYWKDDLRTYLADLEENSKHMAVDIDYREYKLEKALLLSAFTIRLLMDANKLSDNIDGYSVKIVTYPARKSAQKGISPLNKRFIDERYFDFSKPRDTSTGLRRIVNQLIHSAVVVSFDYDEKERAIGFYVVSDRDYDKGLHYCKLKDWIKMLEAVVNDEIFSVSMFRDAETGSWQMEKRGRPTDEQPDVPPTKTFGPAKRLCNFARGLLARIICQ